MKDEDEEKYSPEECGGESVWEVLGIAGDSEDSVDVLEASGMTQRQQEHLWDEIRQLRYIDIQMKDAVQTGHEASLAFWQVPEDWMSWNAICGGRVFLIGWRPARISGRNGGQPGTGRNWLL